MARPVGNMLTIPESEIRQKSPGNVLAACWRQWRSERTLARRGIRFRDSNASVVAAAYAAMSHAQFDAINARQDWANWRTIPRALSGQVPDRPLRVLDLGCGTGSSTRVLAHYCPPGSCILGYEMVQSLLDEARRRTYLHKSRKAVSVTFVCQGVTEPFRQPDGGLVPDHSLDLVNASGVVGHHLNRESFPLLAKELGRVLAAEGVAMLDVGPSLPARELIALMRKHGFRPRGRWRSWCLDPTGLIVFGKQVKTGA